MSSPPIRLALLVVAALSLALAASAARPLATVEQGRVRVGAVALPELPGLALETVVGTEERWVAAATFADGFALFVGDGSGARRLPAPPRAASALRRELLPLLGDDGALAGLAWLEGTSARRLAVRFARWDGTAWERTTTVSPPGAGSQLALAATALADGRLLLAWSAFDGEDDEVLWSVWDGTTWTAPAPIAADNRVPDITPALVAVEGGALAAWATFDGTAYRVVASRFAAGQWSTPRPVAPSGTAFPTFEAATPAPLLLVRTALPRGWIVVEIGADGLPRRAAFAAAAGTERPVVEDAGGAVALDWPAHHLPRRLAPWTSVAPEADR
ncbi:MAG TPA: hypothetical protein VM617_03525 [Thermoanaerobaculia bacterium]|nr:hypothetical protein [Thermoanaerobaculia bacterium]